jgi:hypothetical protein
MDRLIRIRLIPFFVVALVACAPATPTPDITASVVRDFVTAFNAGNKDATLALFTGEPEVYRRNFYWRGQAKVREWVREAIENYRDRIEIIEMKTEGAKAKGLVRVVSAGTERFYLKTDYLYTFQAIVQNGKLACLNIGQPVSGICGE